jgi:O-acetyl-ADP-ribose deacetylase (regulator of RNase III)
MSRALSVFTTNNSIIRLVEGDITDQDTDAIVNAANSSLMGGGGVDGAIHRRGGPAILKECKKIRISLPEGLPTGKAVITTGGSLRAHYVIHTVGPVWKGGHNNEPQLLRDAYINSLKLAVENGVQSISFPSISTGTYGYPIGEAAGIVLKTLKQYLSSATQPEEIRLVLFKRSDLEIYQKTAHVLLIQSDADQYINLYHKRYS